MPHRFEISNENDAWEVFFQLAELLEDDQSSFDIRIKNWPDTHILLRGENFSGTFSSDTIRFVHDMQSAINRAYAVARYGVANSSVLSKEERDAIKLYFRVEEGSSDIVTNIASITKSFLEGMDSDQKYKLGKLCILGLLLLLGGGTGLSAYMEDRRLERLDASTTKITQEILGNQKFASKQDTERMNRLFEFAEQNIALSKILIEAEGAHESILKTAKKADESEIYGNEIDRVTAKELTKTSKEKPKEVRLDGAYRVVKINDPSKDSAEFQVNLIELNSDNSFAAIIDQNMVATEDLEMVFSALKNKEDSVYLNINARMSKGRILEAHIIRARAVDDIEPAAGN